MKPARNYKPKKMSNSLKAQIWKDRGFQEGVREPKTRYFKNPKLHTVANWQCEYCTTRFLFRAETVCNLCGNCQSCGIYHENREDTNCICGNHLPDNAPAIIRRKVRVLKTEKNLTDTKHNKRV